MPALIASDLHGSLTYAQKLADAMRREGADRLILLGDLLGFGAGPGDPCAAVLNEFAPVTFAVRGNCDGDCAQDALEFSILAPHLQFEYAGTSFFITHGHEYSFFRLPPFLTNAVFLQGHTHVPASERHGSVLCLNPGSIALPRGGAPHSYLVFDGKTFCWKDADGTLFRRLEMEKK